MPVDFGVSGQCVKLQIGDVSNHDVSSAALEPNTVATLQHQPAMDGGWRKNFTKDYFGGLSLPISDFSSWIMPPTWTTTVPAGGNPALFPVQNPMYFRARYDVPPLNSSCAVGPPGVIDSNCISRAYIEQGSTQDPNITFNFPVVRVKAVDEEGKDTLRETAQP